MPKFVKRSISEKEAALVVKLEKTKKELSELRVKRARECGEMLAKLGLSKLEDSILLPELETLARRLVDHENPKK